MIYADHNATTPPLPEVVAAMTEALREGWGNPASVQHPQGRRAAAAVALARGQVAALIGAQPAEIVFTSGATAALNLAILGLGERLLPTRPRTVTCATEHPAVLAPLERLREAGAEVVILPVDRSGRLDPAALAQAIDARTGLVCLMAANHETGVEHRIGPAAELAHRQGALLVCDATQAVGKVPVEVARMGADALAFTAHKLHGPQGCGALWLRRGLAPAPLTFGGNQERGLHPGTPNLPGIVGFGAACAAAMRDLAARRSHLALLGARLEALVRQAIPDVVLQGADAPRIPGTSMFTIPGLPKGWLTTLSEVSASSGSACTTGQPSTVLRAMGCDLHDAGNSIRISLGIGNTLAEMDVIAAALAKGVAALRT